MTPIDIIEQIYRSAAQPTLRLQTFTTELRHWYQAFPSSNYLQPCVIDGRAALICQRQLSAAAPPAFRALAALCAEHGIYLKEDARSHTNSPYAAHNRRKLAVVLTFCLTMAATTHASGVNTPAYFAAQQNQAVSAKFDSQSLSTITSDIAKQTGISFRFDAAVEKDKINATLNARDWKGGLAQLLQAYNYSTVQEGNVIKTVFITGYRGGIKPVTVNAVQNSITETIPDQYQDFLQNATTADISLPTDQLADLPEGGSMPVDLPVGSFIVTRESMVELEDGTMSWVGTMDAESQFYRLYLAQTPDGDVIGNIFTPNGSYNIETIDGQTVMVEVQQLSLR
jgi:hypothetical protein